MRVILLRHAARSTSGLGDSSLNMLGQRQADELASLLAPQGPLPVPTRLFASPKKRAQETLRPLADTAHLVLEADARLDERHQNETTAEFEARIRSALVDLVPDRRDGSVYICSHMDWLEAAMVLIPSNLSEFEIAAGWSNCEFKIFRIDQGIWSLASKGVVNPKKGHL